MRTRLLSRHPPAVLRAADDTVLVRRWIERRGVVLATAAALFVVVFALRQLSNDSGAGVSLLYTVPIALLAVELGLLGGLLGAGLSVALLAVWSQSSGVDLDVVGYVTRGTALTAVGVVAGRFSDRMRMAHVRQQQLVTTGLELAHLTTPESIADILARGARTLVGRNVLVEIDGLPRSGDDAVDRPRCQVPIASRSVRYGTLTVDAHRPLTAEDHAALALLALQAAVASENQRLLADARERARIRVELHDAQRRLEERGDQLRELIASQEAERHQVAHELHEEAAQMLAAVLLGLRSLERELDSQLGAPQIDALRSSIDSTLRSLRSLAGTLRPSVLDLGLEAALERLAHDSDRPAAVGDLTVVLNHPDGIEHEAQTTVYRIIEEALKAMGPGTHVEVREVSDGELAIDLRNAGGELDRRGLALLGARLTPVGGTLDLQDHRLHLTIPLERGYARRPSQPR